MRLVKRGITLIEVLLVSSIIAMLMAGIGRAYVIGLNYDQTLKRGRDADRVHQSFENAMTLLLQHAYLNSEQSTYFIASSGAPTATAGGGTTSGSTTAQAGTGGQGVSGGGADTLTFSCVGMRVSGPLLNSQDDFETANTDFGVHGGLHEVEIGPNPVGSPSNGQTGLFFRQQTPADADPTQGGTETLLSSEVTSISYQFYDGTQWIQDWDSRTGQKRLPAAVQATYQIQGEPSQRTLIVRLPYSDVTPQNPLVVAGQ